jgi:hypothetical protein
MIFHFSYSLPADAAPAKRLNFVGSSHSVQSSSQDWSLTMAEDGRVFNGTTNSIINFTFISGGVHIVYLQFNTLNYAAEFHTGTLLSTDELPNGEVDLRPLTLSNSYWQPGIALHKVWGDWQNQCQLQFNNCEDQVIDLQHCLAGFISITDNGVTGVIWPEANPRLRELYMGRNKLSGPLVFPAYPGMQTLAIGDAGGTGQRGSAYTIESVDISLMPDLRTYHGHDIYTRVLISNNNNPQLRYLNVRNTRFSARAAVGGNFNSLRSVMLNASQLWFTNLRNGGLSETECAAVLDVLYDRRNNGIAQYIYLDEQGWYSFYPQVTFDRAYNAPLVSRETVGKMQALQALGHTVEANKPVLYLRGYNYERIRIRYGGDQNVTLWSAGDIVNMFDRNSMNIEAGFFQVAGGDGKQFELQARNGLDPDGEVLGMFDWAITRPIRPTSHLYLNKVDYPLRLRELGPQNLVSVCFRLRYRRDYTFGAPIDNRDWQGNTGYYFDSETQNFLLYVNGALWTGNFGWTGTPYSSGQWCTVYLEVQSGFLANSLFFSGMMCCVADLRVYNRLWTNAEKASLGAFPNDYVARWDFSNRSGNEFQDSDGRGFYIDYTGTNGSVSYVPATVYNSPQTLQGGSSPLMEWRYGWNDDQPLPSYYNGGAGMGAWYLTPAFVSFRPIQLTYVDVYYLKGPWEGFTVLLRRMDGTVAALQVFSQFGNPVEASGNTPRATITVEPGVYIIEVTNFIGERVGTGDTVYDTLITRS